MKEKANFYSRPDVYGLQFLHAQYVNHKFARHVHDYFVLGIIEGGLQTFSYRGVKHGTATSGIILLNPDEPHTGEAATPAGFTYKALYPSVDLMQSIAAEITPRRSPIPYFSAPVIYDRDLAQRFLHLHYALVNTNTTLEGEVNVLGVFATLIARYADTRVSAPSIGDERVAIRRVREYIEAHYDQNVSLAELAQLVSFSPFHLARVFKAQMGIPPHAYLESIRIRQAQRLLAFDQPLAEVAGATGFTDQSHFTNRFKRFMGVTPAQYAKQSNQSKILQDSFQNLT
jgi:AraC-like DNA-binding protein